MQIREPYHTREIIVFGDDSDDRAIAEWDHSPDLRGDHRERMGPIAHYQ